MREGGFPGTITGSESSGYGDPLGQLFTFDNPTWTVGVTFSYPLGKSLAEANPGASAHREGPVDSAAARDRAGGGARCGVAGRAEPAADRDDAARQRAGGAAARREAKRFEVGMSTSFLVIQAQRDLVVARNNELQAALDYQRAAEGQSPLSGTSLPAIRPRRGEPWILDTTADPISHNLGGQWCEKDAVPVVPHRVRQSLHPL